MRTLRDGRVDVAFCVKARVSCASNVRYPICTLLFTVFSRYLAYSTSLAGEMRAGEVCKMSKYLCVRMSVSVTGC